MYFVFNYRIYRFCLFLVLRTLNGRAVTGVWRKLHDGNKPAKVR